MTYIEELSKKIEAGAVVLAATDRLARDLRVRLSVNRREAGELVWDKPPVYSLRRFAVKEWEDTFPMEQLLHPVQELSLYNWAAGKAGVPENMLSRNGLVRLMLRDAQLVRSHQIDLGHDDIKTTDEQAIFRAVQELVDAKLVERGWMVQGQVLQAMREKLATGEWQPPGRVLLAGFRVTTPDQREFIEALVEAGTEIEEIGDEVLAGEIEMRRYSTPRAEARAVAAEIRELLKPYAGTEDEPPKIGVVVPNAREAREGLEAAFKEILAPHSLLPRSGELDASERRLPWRWSRGFSVAEHPLVVAALDLLSLSRHGNPVRMVSRLLLSSCMWGPDEAASRAAIDVALRDRGGAYVSLDAVLRLALARNGENRRARTFGRITAKQVVGLIRMLRDENDSALPSVWAERFGDRVKQLGWPAGAKGTSEGYQVGEAWTEALSVLGALDAQTGKLDWANALRLLREVLVARDFQPRVQYLQPVFIGEPRDMAGLVFDQLYILGLSSAVLPEPPTRSPFIDVDTLVEAGVKTATPEGASEDGADLLQHLLTRASSISVSCPMHDKNGAPLLPSPLVTNWPEDVETKSAGSFVDKAVEAGDRTEMPDADPVPPVGESERERLRGGAGLFGDFITQPFYAFARRRLGAEPLPDLVYGIDAARQGNLLHAALEFFWARHLNRQALRNLIGAPGDAFDIEVERAVEYAVSERRLLLPEVFGWHLVALERRRLKSVIQSWLRYEADRELDFEVVAIEKEIYLDVLGVRVKMRLDRADKVYMENGEERFVIIDYKTGANVKEDFRPDAMMQPQLPLEAAFDAHDQIGIPRVDGVAYGHVRERGPKFVFRGEFAGSLGPGDGSRNRQVDNWLEWKDAWRDELEGVAEGILAGRAELDFGKRPGRFDKSLHLLVRHADVAEDSE